MIEKDRKIGNDIKYQDNQKFYLDYLYRDIGINNENRNASKEVVAGIYDEMKTRLEKDKSDKLRIKLGKVGFVLVILIF